MSVLEQVGAVVVFSAAFAGFLFAVGSILGWGEDRLLWRRQRRDAGEDKDRERKNLEYWERQAEEHFERHASSAQRAARRLNAPDPEETP